MAIPATHNLEELLERTEAEWIAAAIDSLPQLETAADRLNTVRAVIDVAHGRDRDKMAATKPFGTDTLIGSFFRAPDQDDPNAEAAWLDGEPCKMVEGMVVAQPFTSSTSAIYLVEFYDAPQRLHDGTLAAGGASGYQQLVELERMLAQRWTFYDSDAWLSVHRPKVAEALEVPNDEVPS